MRSWQVISVQRIIGDKFLVTYYIGGTEKHTVRVDATFGLEKAITDTGIQLANLPPRIVPPVGGH